jgi:hypothetical protein
MVIFWERRRLGGISVGIPYVDSKGDAAETSNASCFLLFKARRAAS